MSYKTIPPICFSYICKKKVIVGWCWEEIQKHVIYPAWKGKWHIRAKVLHNSARTHISDASSWRSRTCWHRFSLIFSCAYRFKWNLSTQIWEAADFLITLLQWSWLSFYWRDAFLLQVMLWNVPDWWRIIWCPLNPIRIQDFMTSLA